MEPYIVPKDWLVAIALLGVGAGLALPLTQRNDWIGWVAVVAISLLAMPIFVFASYCCYARLHSFLKRPPASTDNELEH
ncbi:hypothetical protein [Rubripirellula reticaptiva]|uniref:MraY-like glycosyltransferase n=1 Tax=Rubripirellula reticaptiva TaxID=2528013 RepID=A0A5C6EWG8_9BACT|nr:hypothetical protein [Rubripirellula reticaptiva]TWU52036.1 hypothetical protein Poly59_36330 [Rubripirellula reticaptiva]